MGNTSTLEAPRPQVRVGAAGGTDKLVDFVPSGALVSHYLNSAGITMRKGDGLSISGKKGTLATVIDQPETVIVVAPDVRNG